MTNGPVSTSSDNSSLEKTTVELRSIKHDGPKPTLGRYVDQ